MKEIKNCYTVSGLNYLTGKNQTMFVLAGSFQVALDMVCKDCMSQGFEFVVKAVTLIADDVNY